MAVTRYVWAVYGTVAARPLGKAPDSQLTVPFMRDHEGFKRSRLDSYNDDSELVVRIQSRALEAHVARGGVPKSRFYDVTDFRCPHLGNLMSVALGLPSGESAVVRAKMCMRLPPGVEAPGSVLARG